MTDKFNIQKFKTEIDHRGFLNATDYVVTIGVPKMMMAAPLERAGRASTAFTTFAPSMQMRAESCALPGLALRSAFINRTGVGPLEKMPYAPVFTDTSITFLLDREADFLAFFYSWINTIYTFAPAKGTPMYTGTYKDDYVTTIKIDLFDRRSTAAEFDTPRMSIILKDAFPDAVNEIPLGYGMSDSVIRLVVGFTFKDWEIVGSPTNITPSGMF